MYRVFHDYLDKLCCFQYPHGVRVRMVLRIEDWLMQWRLLDVGSYHVAWYDTICHDMSRHDAYIPEYGWRNLHYRVQIAGIGIALRDVCVIIVDGSLDCRPSADSKTDCYALMTQINRSLKMQWWLKSFFWNCRRFHSSLCIFADQTETQRAQQHRRRPRSGCGWWEARHQLEHCVSHLKQVRKR